MTHQEQHVTMGEAQAASEITQILSEAGMRRNDGLDCLAIVVVGMMVATKMTREDAYATADDLAKCIKDNFDLNIHGQMLS